MARNRCMSLRSVGLKALPRIDRFRLPSMSSVPLAPPSHRTLANATWALRAQFERLAARRLVSGFPAIVSLGGMVGAAIGGALPSAGVWPQQHLLGAAVVCLVAILLACGAMLRMDGPPASGSPLSLPRGALALIGALAAMGLVAEGAMYDWSVL